MFTRGVRSSLEFLVVGAFLHLIPMAAHGQSQAHWPARPITIVVPYAAGSLPDAFFRPIAHELGARLKVPVVVENVNGAGGVLGTSRVVQAKPDGYTFGLGVESTVVIAQMVKPTTVKYDGLKDLAPIALMGSSPLVLVARPGLGVSSMNELLVKLRANPGALSYGTSGIGTSLHLAGEMLNQQAQLDIKHIPYSVSTQIMTDVVGDQLDLAMVPVGSALSFIKAGRAKPLGVTSPVRAALLPEVPSMSELAILKEMNINVWFGLFAPAGIDKAIADTLSSHAGAIVATEQIQQHMLALSVQPDPMDSLDFGRFLVQERNKFQVLVTRRQIKAE